MRFTDDGTAVKLGYGKAATKSIPDYVSYMQALSVKPYLSIREASIFFDVGIGRVHRLFEREELASNIISRGQSPMMRKDVIERELLAEGAGDSND